MWAKLSCMFHDMLNALTGQCVNSSRGEIPEFERRPFLSPPGDSDPFLNKTTKVRKMFHELSKKNCHRHEEDRVWMTNFDRTKQNIKNGLTDLGCSIPNVGNSFEETSQFISLASTALISYDLQKQYDTSQKAISKWKQQLKISNSSDRKQVFRWLKGVTPNHPKTLERSDGSLTGNPNEILDLLTNHIEGIYNKHRDTDEDRLFRDFCDTFEGELDALTNPVELPAFDFYHMWSLFQKKPIDKATGLDGWKVRELQALPPCAWKAIKLFFSTVEVCGEWPKAFTLVSMSAIPKTSNWTCDSTRAIGITAVLYSFWASYRFKQLSGWLGNIAPSSLAGGLPARSAASSEIELSCQLFESDELFDPQTVVFIDRWKCFDMLLPNFCIKLCSRLGVPSHITRPLQGFYQGQTKFFKLHHAFGKQVLHCNGVVQGCAFSVLFANLIFSVFAKKVEALPGVSFSAFIDDTKLWASQKDLPSLIDATTKLQAFDRAVGQFQNDAKSALLTKKKRDAERFLLQVGRRIPHVKKAKSLGFYHSVSSTGNGKALGEKIKRAAVTIRKVGKLPLPSNQKNLYIKVSGHSQWLFGSETTVPNQKSIKSLRTAVVDSVFPKNNNLRCPFMTVSTWGDPWVDPWAAWVRHVLTTYRKLHRTNPDLVTKVFSQAQKVKPHAFRLKHGAPVVLAIIVHQLDWKWKEEFRFDRPGDSNFDLLAGSQHFFERDLERSVRRALFMSSPIRHDNLGDSREGSIDIFATRYLLDNDMRTIEPDADILRQISNLSVTIEHARNIIQNFLAGSIFDGPRKFHAKLASSPDCSICGDVDNLLHMCKSCKLTSTPELNQQFPDTTWTTGIHWEREDDQPVLYRKANDKPFQFYNLPDRKQAGWDHPIFTDGSCYRSASARVARSACSVFSPGFLNLAVPLPGLDHSSQRAEIGAALLAMQVTHGDLLIYTDCLNVVKGFQEIQRNNWNLSSMAKWDNFDLWALIAQEYHSMPRPIIVRKVVAHGRDATQSTNLTMGNQHADGLAKKLASDLFKDASDSGFRSIRDIVVLQLHLVTVFVQHELFSQTPDDPEAVADRFAYKLKASPSCTCKPPRRILGKSTILCRGLCNRSNLIVDVERSFLNLPRNRAEVPARVWEALRIKFPSLAQWLTCSGNWPQTDVSNFELQNRGQLEFLKEYVHQSRWCRGKTTIEAYTPWSIVLIDLISRIGFKPPFFSKTMGFGKLVLRCHRYLGSILQCAFPGAAKSVTNNSLGSAFGFRKQTAFGAHLIPASFSNVWCILVQACLESSTVLLGGRKFRSRWVPDWDLCSFPGNGDSWRERVSCVHVLFDFVKSLVSSRACKAPKELWKKCECLFKRTYPKISTENKTFL